MKTEFRDIPGYEGLYQASDDGFILGLKRGFFLSKRNVREYNQVVLYKNSKPKALYVHRLIMLTFIGPSNLDVNHKDGDKSNNNLYNLEYMTESQNTIHAYKLGLMPDNRGENAGGSKLTEEQVLEIRKLRKNGLKLKDIAKIYDIDDTTVSDITRFKTWKHI